MKQIRPGNEEGSILIIALIMLVLLTLVGISATTTTTIELRITGNERTFLQDFYVADSGWKIALDWLNNQATPPPNVNSTNGIIQGVPYSYSATSLGSSGVVGSSPSDGYQSYSYRVTCVANGTQSVEVTIEKVFKEGY